MLTFLFSLGRVTFYTFGFFFAIGFFLAAFIVWRRLKDLGFKEEKIIDGIIFSTIFGLFVSRIFFIFQNFQNFRFSLSRWFLVNRYPGFSFWGGIGGTLLSLFLFCRKQKWNFWRVMDEVTFGILPFLFLIQLGTFLNGAGAGRPTDMFWGVFFPGGLVRQHPVSLFMAIFLLLIWLVILKIERHWRTWSWYKSQAPGFITLVWLGLMFLTNLPLAFLKESKLYFYWLEVILSLLGLVVSGVLIWQKRK